MAITMRLGPYAKMDPIKALPGEWLVVTSGHPTAKNGRAVYLCFAAGYVKRMYTYEDAVEYLQEASAEIVQIIAKALEADIETAISSANDATLRATQSADAAYRAEMLAIGASNSANWAAQDAEEAAEEARQYVLGDISQKTVDFTIPDTYVEPSSGESTASFFGKVVAGLRNVLGKIGNMGQLTTTAKATMVAAINELVSGLNTTNNNLSTTNSNVAALNSTLAVTTRALSGATLDIRITRLSGIAWLYCGYAVKTNLSAGTTYTVNKVSENFVHGVNRRYKHNASTDIVVDIAVDGTIKITPTTAIAAGTYIQFVECLPVAPV
ncbi:hypothetical protein M2454_002944 [Aequitasia blattaphilus]|uniref:Tail fiber protein n=1 Tax=Aequitasia blattaphilus TaxID=2949332 RepID=A0ABT1ECL7_9FIRM|nr:hypothetical protein [Aequitasia blattaphilus]MCP1103591.1 hypothetical protein [Aequitasia blattaphilus]MCR8616231.1 hypothetical protein [Aequitasia blattaphilus]